MPELSQTFSACWQLPDRRPIYEWARENLELPACLPIKGKFDIGNSLHFKEPLDALQSDYVRQVVVRKPVRGGGTLISDIWHCWTRANDPGPQLVVLDDDSAADDHAEKRLMPMLRSVAAIRSLLPADRHKQRKADIVFTDGQWLKVVGPAFSNLQRVAVRYMSLDELWRYKPGTIEQAEARLGDFIRTGTSKLAIISQEGAPGGDVETRAEQGDCCEWVVECQGCRRHIWPQWSYIRSDGSRAGMRWDVHKSDAGEWLVDKCLESVRFECPECGHVHIDGGRTKGAWNANGKYLAQNISASRAHRSFRWNAIIDFPWTELVRLYLMSMNAYRKGATEPLIAWWQKRMVQAKDPGALNDSSIEFKVSAYGIPQSAVEPRWWPNRGRALPRVIGTCSGYSAGLTINLTCSGYRVNNRDLGRE